MKNGIQARVGGRIIDLSALDVRYIVSMIRRDVKYQKSRSARSRTGADANLSKVNGRSLLANRLLNALEAGDGKQTG